MSDRPLDYQAGDKSRRDSRRNSFSLPNPWESHQVAPELHHEGTSLWFMEGERKAEADAPTALHEATWRMDHMDLPPMLVEYSANAMTQNKEKDLPPPPYFAEEKIVAVADFPHFSAKHGAGLAAR